MRKIYDDQITLRNPSSHAREQTLSGTMQPDGHFTIFEFDQTQRYFDQHNMTITPGALILSEDETFICIEHHFKENRPKKLVCKTIRVP